MKIQIDTAGAMPASPAFDMLRASFVAAQAATPTAQAAPAARRTPPAGDALTDLFAGADPADAARALRGSFARGDDADAAAQR